MNQTNNICNTSWGEHEKVSRGGIKRRFEGQENIQGIIAVGEMNWKHFFPLWKRLELCWKTQKWKHRTFCFQAVSKALSLVLTTFGGKGFDKSHAQPNEEGWESKGEQRCQGTTKPSMGGSGEELQRDNVSNEVSGTTAWFSQRFSFFGVWKSS